MKADEASSTAYTVSQGIVYSGRYSEDRGHVPGSLLDSNEFILRSSRAGRKLLRRLESPIHRLLLRLFERLTLPGMAFHYVLRKMYIEHCVRDAISDGAQQVIVLGAGFDTLAWRLSTEFGSIRFIEVDHPATSKDKNEALVEQIKLTKNYYFAAVDFARENLLDALSGCQFFDQSLKSVFVCEGVLMYLSLSDVELLLSSVSQLTSQRSQLIFTALEPLDSPNNDSGWLLRLYLRIKQESLGWTCAQSLISPFLEKHHYHLIESVDDRQIASMLASGLLRQRFHRGEYIINAMSEHSSQG
ncbi:class I SAM-dependent methyltransferase [Synechococcus sp. MIT S1220]|uniref:class I SAM-dependent methyltransferase n=1 Tax=Synechococcus sp. MIT S1220 TaxID=3082549 RepID=UPI0039B00328